MWTGVGSGVDSYYEYLVKGSKLLGEPKWEEMFASSYYPELKKLKIGHWYYDIKWYPAIETSVPIPIASSLDLYFPGKK
jgi:mannosidase alpha-like ER degradation enhancer 2